MTDPHIQQLAEIAVKFATFLNYWPMRVALFLTGVSIIVWRWRPYWILRHNLLFFWRRFLGGETWISYEEALKVIRASDWSRIREPNVSILEAIGNSAIFSTGVTAPGRKEIIFRRYIEMTLERFESLNPAAARIQDGAKFYSEERLRRFMAKALDDEALKTFGDLPNRPA